MKFAIYDNTDRLKGIMISQVSPNGERQILYDPSYMQNIKTHTNKKNTYTENKLIERTDQQLPEEEMEGEKWVKVVKR